ncbi:MAG: hypothetical protein WAS34_18905 [Thiolinea sp.]
METKLETLHGYTIGDTVYVKPKDANVLKGVVKYFQVVDKRLPIVECDNPNKKGEKVKIVCDLDRVSKTKTVTTYEWKLVAVKHTYKD